LGASNPEPSSSSKRADPKRQALEPYGLYFSINLFEEEEEEEEKGC